MGSVSTEIEAYAAYLNAPRDVLEHEEQVLFDQDLLKARAAMERVWLEAKPTNAALDGGRSPHPPPVIRPVAGAASRRCDLDPTSRTEAH